MEYDIKDTQLPIVYRHEYNVAFLGLEKLHPFDAHKWKHIFEYLKRDGLLDDEMIISPSEAKKDLLLLVHTRKYLSSLKWSINVACIAEIPLLCFVPNYLVQKCYLQRMRYQVGGSVMAGCLALKRGYAINIGGGFHHCCANEGAGFCPYADITLLIKYLFKHFTNLVTKVMIVDLDAHQGNGYERDFLDNNDVYIMDVYNKEIYPSDSLAKQAIRKKVELRLMTQDDEYLAKIDVNLVEALKEFEPNLIVYNAGTDILEGDPLGRLAITPQGVIQRDELVFTKARTNNIPIVMLTSGGYLKESARIIADSIMNLKRIGIIQKV